MDYLRVRRNLNHGLNRDRLRKREMDTSDKRRKEKAINVLLAEDEQDVREVVSRVIVTLGYRCHKVGNGQEAIDAMAEDAYDIVITDMQMPVLGGMALLEHVKRFYPSVDVLVVTGFDEDYSFTEMISKGASDFMAKPFSPGRTERQDQKNYPGAKADP